MTDLYNYCKKYIVNGKYNINFYKNLKSKTKLISLSNKIFNFESYIEYDFPYYGYNHYNIFIRIIQSLEKLSRKQENTLVPDDYQLDDFVFINPLKDESKRIIDLYKRSK